MSNREDVRRADKVEPFKLVKAAPEDVPMDRYAMMSLCFALGAIMFKVPFYAWLTLLFCMASLANQRTSQIDIRSVVANVLLVFLTFLSTHFNPTSKPLLFPTIANWLQRL